MYCKQCGNELSNDSQFCPKCGSSQNSVGRSKYYDYGYNLSKKEFKKKYLHDNQGLYMLNSFLDATGFICCGLLLYLMFFIIDEDNFLSVLLFFTIPAIGALVVSMYIEKYISTEYQKYLREHQ